MAQNVDIDLVSHDLLCDIWPCELWWFKTRSPSLCPFIPEENGWVIYHRCLCWCNGSDCCWPPFKKHNKKERDKIETKKRQTDSTRPKGFFLFKVLLIKKMNHHERKLRKEAKEEKKIPTKLPIALMILFSLIEFGLNAAARLSICAIAVPTRKKKSK